MKKICRGIVYFTVLCDHPCLVSLLFAVLVSLHPVTFSNVFYYLFMSLFFVASALLPVLRVPGAVLSRQFFAMRGVLLVMKTLKDERYAVIKACKCTVSEI